MDSGRQFDEINKISRIEEPDRMDGIAECGGIPFILFIPSDD